MAGNKRSSARRSKSTGIARPHDSGSRYFQRDESWLLFNDRVLEEALDPTNPLLERVKFLAITASNLDEFIEIRIAGVLQQMEEDAGLPQFPDEGGLTPVERLQRLRDMLHHFVALQDECWNKHLVPELREAGIRLQRWKSLSEDDRLFAARFYHDQVDPLLTPVTIDPSHPFPRVLNKALCLALLLRNNRKGTPRSQRSLGVITVPRSLPRLIALPERNGQRNYLLLDELIEAHVDHMFRGYKVLNRAAFRVTRNSNLYLEEEESRSVLESVRSELHNRRKGDAVRLQIDASADPEIIERLRVNFELDDWQVFRTSAPVNLSRLLNLYSIIKAPALKFPEFTGREYRPQGNTADIFADLRTRDILLHHPFDSYSTIENVIAAAARDPDVISIKQTLYRTSDDSPIFQSLKDAAQTKDVTVVVELMARFDEDSNIRWARELEDAGVQVFHGIFGLKTHCKLALLVRRDPDGIIRRYAHLGTGNYNPVTARFYTDLSLLTSREELTEPVQRVFRYLTADWETDEDTYRPLLVAPITLAHDLERLIDREAAHAREGKPARIIAKMNALLDQRLIETLYLASNAGVDIELIVRGMCALRPGVPGMSERITVRSIVGRFLEHTRLFWFANDTQPEVFGGSADWMPRNLYERCEVVFPIDEPGPRRRLHDEILAAYLRDNRKTRLLQPDGTYVRIPIEGTPFSAQEWLIEQARKPISPPRPTPHRPLTPSAQPAQPARSTGTAKPSRPARSAQAKAPSRPAPTATRKPAKKSRTSKRT